jgi:hypothetical protein
LDVGLLEPDANDVVKRRSLFTIHAIDCLRSEHPSASVIRGADPRGEERRLGAAATRVLERAGRAEPAERTRDVRRAKCR